jgi:flagellar biosynthetic protein FliP
VDKLKSAVSSVRGSVSDIGRSLFGRRARLNTEHPVPNTEHQAPNTGSRFFTTRLVHALTGRKALLFAGAIVLLIGLTGGVSAQGGHAVPAVTLPSVQLGVGQANNPKDVAVTLQILLLMTVLTLAPSLLIMTTAFTRIIIVLSIMRSALGIPQVPPNQVIVGLAMFLTYFVMRPTFDTINHEALQPYFANKITFQDGMDRAAKPLRSFMLRQTYDKDFTFFVNLAKLKEAPRTPEDVPISVVVPAFITSELKTAFTMGFYIFLPFLVIDMVVASTLMSMGMMMLPPTLIALPAKLLLFVLANGWTLLIGSLAKGFR